MLKKTLLFTLVIAPILALTLTSATVWFLYQQRYEGAETTFTVKPGDTFGVVNARLSREGLISNPRLFHWMARYKGVMGKLRAGPFTIPSQSKMEDVLNILVYGQPNLTGVTIPEGRNMYQVAEILSSAGFGDKQTYIDLCKDPSFISALGVEGPTLEGYLFPETYKFAPGTAPREVLTTMVEHFRTRVGTLTQGHEFLTPHEVVVLASVVEKETGAKEERPQIASVFLNRLKKRMRLESDPTTIYGMWERYTGNIRRDDLQELTPYNTYKIPALPLGPIANPSYEAMAAVMKPAVTDYLFFVSKNDGTHVFTKNYQDHQAAVNEWQRKRSNREGKSWRQLQQ
jgi:UPF0755 protein